MKSFLKFVVLVFFLLFAFNLNAQNDSEHKVNYGGLAQFHFSYARSDSTDDPFGFRVRRIDFKVWQSPNKIIDWSLLLGFADFKFQILEVFVNFRLTDYLEVKAGQFAPPAVRSAAPVDNLYKVPIMSFIERPHITLNWNSLLNLHAYRTFGVQVHGKILNKKLYYGFMVGNPKGSNFFNASSKNVNHFNSENGLSLLGRLEYEILKNFVAGGFYNLSKSNIDKSSLKRSSYGAHILYRRNNTSFMTEFIQGENYSGNIKTKYYRGGFTEIAYRIKSIEPALRFDFYQPSINSSDIFGVKTYINYTFGLNFYPVNKIKIQLNYIFKNEIMVDQINSINNDLFYVNLQFLL